jgi:outer membrane protein
MRRKLLALTAIAFLCLGGAANAQTLKIGYINSQEILASAPGAEAAGQQFDREMQGYQAEVQQLETEIRTMQQQLQQQQLTLSPEAKANREQQMQVKMNQYDARTTQLQELANQRRAALIQPVMDNITTVIESIREEGAYSLILDVAAGSIIAADPALDLTQAVITRLQATAGVAPGGARR